MSVLTTADKKREEALEHVDKAYRLLMEVLDPTTWGSDEYNKEYILKMEKALLRLGKIKRDLI